MDTNCLLSLKNRDGEYREVKELVDMCSTGATLHIPAIAASENQQGGTLMRSFTDFQAFVAAVGCGKSELLYPMLYLDISYLDYAVLSDEKMESLERKIHDILFPKIPFLYPVYCTESGSVPNNGTIDRKWRRAKCDVQSIWCHIYYRNDIFVTQDKNFHKATKKSRLVALGARDILKPSECLSRLKDLQA